MYIINTFLIKIRLYLLNKRYFENNFWKMLLMIVKDNLVLVEC